ncbi:MAG: hypothetical protein WD845_01030 [Pirellulales bacterium]
MKSHDLTKAQLDALVAKPWAMANCLRRLEIRMHHEGFPADDALYTRVSAATHTPAIYVHCQACEKVKRKPKPK